MRKISLIILILTLELSSLLGQPQNTTLRSNWDDNSLDGLSGLFYNDIWGYADEQGREFAIIGTVKHTVFINVTNPDQPIEIDRILGGKSCVWRDFKTYDHYAYGVSDGCGDGLEVFDLSDLPNSVSKVLDSDAFFSNAHNIFIDSSSARLYVCGITQDTSDLKVLDLSTSPQSPTLIKSINLDVGGDYIHDLFVRNDTAYLCNGNQSRMLIYDMSDLDNIELLGQVASNGYNHSAWISDNSEIAIIADETHNRPLQIVDITDMDVPVLESTIKSTLLAPNHTNSLAHNPFIIGNDFAIISYYEDGLQIYRIDDPENPFRAGYYDTRPGNNNTYSGSNGAWGVYPFLPSGNIIVSDMENGLFVVTPNFPLRDCESDISITGIYDNTWSFNSKDRVDIKATFHDNADLDVFAPDSIVFSVGFEIELGSEMNADTQNKCSTNGLLVGRYPERTSQKIEGDQRTPR